MAPISSGSSSCGAQRRIRSLPRAASRRSGKSAPSTGWGWTPRWAWHSTRIDCARALSLSGPASPVKFLTIRLHETIRRLRLSVLCPIRLYDIGAGIKTHSHEAHMTHRSDRREFLRTLTTATLTAASSSLALSDQSFSAPKKSLLVFTKSSGFEHEVVERKDGKLSIVETAVTELGGKSGFDVTCSKDGRIFDSKDFHNYQAVFFFTTGDLTQSATDENPPCRSPASKHYSPPSSRVSDSSAAMPPATLSTPRPIPPTCRTATSPTARNPIPISACSAANSSFTAATRVCRPPTSSSTIHPSPASKALNPPSPLPRNGIRSRISPLICM